MGNTTAEIAGIARTEVDEGSDVVSGSGGHVLEDNTISARASRPIEKFAASEDRELKKLGSLTNEREALKVVILVGITGGEKISERQTDRTGMGDNYPWKVPDPA